MMHWRLHVVTTPGLTLQANFLTRETFLDIVTSCIMPRHPALDRQAHPDPRRASVAKVKGFFQRPCKHYPLTDTYVSGADAEGKELAEQISDLLRNFNQSIQEESKDRKYRFVVKRLMKAHQRAGETLDTELDFYRDDDDVAVLLGLDKEYKPGGVFIDDPKGMFILKKHTSQARTYTLNKKDSKMVDTGAAKMAAA